MVDSQLESIEDENSDDKLEQSKIFLQLKMVIVEQLDVDYNDVNLHSNFSCDLDADSLDAVELIMALEEAFEINIPDKDAEKIQTVKQALQYIELYKNNS
ncbi:acyl carrier protein [Cyanobacterium sp. HL-69]|uniref:acyl carrier protein n=1 Tax=Cyanobacterium sp. HL-69 TaxID=2054282 RepID=UPI00406BB520